MTTLDLTPYILVALEDPAVQERLKSILAPHIASQAVTEPYLTTKQAADLLGMTPNALRQAAYRDTIPCEHLGRRLRFKASNLTKART